MKHHKKSHTDQTDQAIFDLQLENPSMSDSEIGLKIGLTRESVGRRKKRKGYLNLIKTSEDALSKRICFLVAKALSQLELLLDDPDSRVRIAVISIVLKFPITKLNQKSSTDSLEEAIKEPLYFEELLKIPGAGHKILMTMAKKTNNY